MGFSALWIWMFHTWKLLWLPGILRWVEIYTVRTGYYGVDCFFLLSGFGLSFSLSKEPNLRHFYWKRAKKIYPPFIIIGVYHCVKYHFGVLDLLKWISCFSFYTHSIYDLLWYIPAQITLYVFFPLLFKLLDRSGDSTALVMLFLGIWFLLSIIFRTTSRIDLYGFSNRIPDFLIGTWYGHTLYKNHIILSRVAWFLIAFSFLLGLYLGYLTNFSKFWSDIPASANRVPSSLISSTIVLLIPAILEAGLQHPITHYVVLGVQRILSFYGKISLEFYCFQYDVMLIIQSFTTQFPTLLSNMILLLAQTSVALLAHYFIEWCWTGMSVVYTFIKPFFICTTTHL